MSVVAFELMAKLGLDKKAYDEGLNNAETMGKDTGGKIGSALGGAAKLGLMGVTAAVGAASTALIAMGKQAVQQYSQYEQLVGGVEKLYGDAADKVQNYANQAYMTSGMSANAYMETATQFSASLINSLGGDMNAAADMTDIAMKAMSDNVNVFGSDMESVSNAFKGFSKQNFTMLDNLKLGYGGTKTEMERLIADANEYRASIGESSDLTINSFADIVQAIQSIQEKQGIAGTTQAEAMKTLEGSANATKAAWQNVITAIAGGGDLENAFNGLMKTVFGEKEGEGLLANLIPRVQKTMEGIGNFVAKAGPYITEQLPALINSILPGLLESAISLVNALIQALPGIIQGLLDQVPMLINSLVDAFIMLVPMMLTLGFEVLNSLVTGIADALPQALPKLLELVQSIIDSFSDPSKIQQLLETAVTIITTLAEGLVQALPQLIPSVVEIIGDLVIMLTEPDMLAMLIQAALDLIVALALGLVNAIPKLIEAVPVIITNLFEAIIRALPMIITAGIELIIALVKGIAMAIPTLLAQVPELIAGIVKALIVGGLQLVQSGAKLFNDIGSGFLGSISGAAQWGKDLIDNFIGGLLAKWESLKKTVKNIAGSIKDLIGFSEPKKGPLSNFHTYAPDMMDLFMQGINDNKSKLLNTVTDAFDFENLITTPGTIDGAFSVNGGAGGLGANVYNITFNQPMESPIDVARTIREEAQYGLLGG